MFRGFNGCSCSCRLEWGLMLCWWNMQGRLARPTILRGVGDEMQSVLDCPRFTLICRQLGSFDQDADRAMQHVVCHKDQKAVCHCIAAILDFFSTPTKTRLHDHCSQPLTTACQWLKGLADALSPSL